MRHRYSQYLPPITFVSDLLTLNCALTISSFTYYDRLPPVNDNTGAIYFIFNVAWIIIALITKNYFFHRPLSFSAHISKIISSLIYHLVLVITYLYFFEFYDVSKYIIVYSYVLLFLTLLLCRSLTFFVLDYIRKRGFNQRRILLLGEIEMILMARRSFKRHPEYGYKICSLVTDGDAPFYTKDEITKIAIDKDIHEIYLCYKDLNGQYVNRFLNWFANSNINIKIISDLALDPFKISLLRFYDFPVIRLLSKPAHDIKILVLKRGFDIVFSSGVMISGLPVFFMVMLITKFSSRGPVFYRQERIGRNGKPFYIYKFRSMYVNAERGGPQLAKEDDPRVTPWGRLIRKTRLDELPQFYNVLKGDMSVVGPRPERQYFIEQIIDKAPSYKKLLSVKPGITSIGQIKYGYAENIDQMVQRMRYDLLYINKQRLNLDLTIIAGTIKVMIQGKGK